MKLASLLAVSTLAVSPVLAQDTRQLGSHEHGVGQLDIAIDGSQIVMELHAPGADIVGFEYVATSDDDKAGVENALAVLASPLGLFTFPEAAQCGVVAARAELEAEASHDSDHGDHDHDEHDEDHSDHGHDDHDHDDHADHEAEAGHSEFHAEYAFECADVTAVTEISFGYFEAFPNAVELEVRVLSDGGAAAFEVERTAPVLDLGSVN